MEEERSGRSASAILTPCLDDMLQRAGRTVVSERGRSDLSCADGQLCSVIGGMLAWRRRRRSGTQMPCRRVLRYASATV